MLDTILCGTARTAIKNVQRDTEYRNNGSLAPEHAFIHFNDKENAVVEGGPREPPNEHGDQTCEVTRDWPLLDDCQGIMMNPDFWDPGRNIFGSTGHWPLQVKLGSARARSAQSIQKRATRWLNKNANRRFADGGRSRSAAASSWTRGEKSAGGKGNADRATSSSGRGLASNAEGSVPALAAMSPSPEPRKLGHWSRPPPVRLVPNATSNAHVDQPWCALPPVLVSTAHVDMTLADSEGNVTWRRSSVAAWHSTGTLSLLPSDPEAVRDTGVDDWASEMGYHTDGWNDSTSTWANWPWQWQEQV